MRAVGAEERINEAVRARPAPALRPFIAGYHGYRQRGVAPAVHRGLPSPFLTVIFTIDEPLHIAQHVDPRQRPGLYDALIGGLHTSPAVIRHQGAHSGIQLQVSPLGARALLGVPAGELTGIDLHARDVLGPLAERVHQRLQETRTWPERFALLDAMLTTRLGGEPPASVWYVWRRLLASGGGARISDLAGEVGWSQRHLANQFRLEVGLTPKAMARVVRFHRARRLLQVSRDCRLADVAADCGYYDQAHLARDFTALAGCSPRRLMAEHFAFVQATSDSRPEDWPS
jgi:AraC-like DNA-binding protein